jgi:cob(I)alamin adenosyltransferase
MTSDQKINPEKAERHKKRMQRKEEIVDASIERADKNKGLLIVLTGNGKGKSSSAFGMLARALGHGMSGGVAQFIKGRTDTGEEAFFSKQDNVTWHVLGGGFSWKTQDLAADTEKAEMGWQIALPMLQDPEIDLVILDELTYPLKYGWLDTETILTAIAARPPMQHVVITGRAAPKAVIEAADTVSEIGDIKHAFRAGIKAQQGIDL